MMDNPLTFNIIFVCLTQLPLLPIHKNTLKTTSRARLLLGSILCLATVCAMLIPIGIPAFEYSFSSWEILLVWFVVLAAAVVAHIIFIAAYAVKRTCPPAAPLLPPAITLLLGLAQHYPVLIALSCLTLLFTLAVHQRIPRRDR